MTSRIRSLAASVRRSAILPALVGCGWLVLVAGQQGSPLQRGFDPTVLIVAGSNFDPEPLLPAGAHVFRGTGFDGQFFFYLAQDPLARKVATRSRLDNTQYRARRVLLPALSYAASGGGNRELLPWVIPLVNLLATLAATWALASWLRRRERSPWLALAYPTSFGIVSGVISDVADPLAASLLIIGLLAWSEDRTALALLALGLAGLARETYLLPALVICAIELWRFRARALIWLAIPITAGAWFAYVATIPAGGSLERDVTLPSIVPIRGAYDRIAALNDTVVPGVANWELLYILTILATAVFVIWHGAAVAWAGLAARDWPSRERLVLTAGAAAVVLIPFLSAALWRNPLSYGRYGAGAVGILLICVAARRRFAGVLVAGLVVLGLLNPYATVLPMRYGPVINGIDVGPAQP
ncbi:MAG TPA: hypothetical protein VNA28_03785 [Solirubrobacteraceae bacterium]|nr:hypothetical protein [Solirubrobacteraceae bacterium]